MKLFVLWSTLIAGQSHFSRPGAMIVFPAEVVHCVTPYEGERPRITYAWNIGRKAVAGTAASAAKGVPERPRQ